MKKEEREHFNLAEELRKQKIAEEKRRLILKDVKEKIEKEKTMKLSIKEGSFASIMYGLGDYYIIPYALALNANNFQIGLLKSFSGLLPPISQLYGSKLMEKFSRKRIILTYISLQALTWLPIIFLSLLFWKSLLVSYLPYFLIAFYTLYAIFGSIATPAWFSLLGDIVPDNIRGKYFGKRNRITGAVGLVSTLTAAFLLDFFKTKGYVLIGFSILFFLASIARLISAYYFKKHYQPKFKQKKKFYFSFLQFLKGVKKYNFTKFSVFASCMHFSIMIASPFFAVYMLDKLGFSYTTFMFITLSSSIANILLMPIWGKFSDKYGRKETMLLSTVLISIMPILWLFSSSPYYLLLPNIIGGIGWAGFSLASFNFIYDSTGPEKRALCVSYYNILLGIGTFIGSALGGLILQGIPLLDLTMNKFFVVFFISALLRGLTSMIFLPHIKEVRKVRKFHPITSFKRFEHGMFHEIIGGFIVKPKKTQNK